MVGAKTGGGRNKLKGLQRLDINGYLFYFLSICCN